MSLNFFYNFLSNPAIYRLSQSILAPGAEKKLTSQIKQICSNFPATDRILDAGCGPSSLLWKINKNPIGLDILFQYSRDFSKKGKKAVTGSIAEMPFAENSFDNVWCIGVLHHLPDALARQAISEMIQVCKSGGYVIIFDAVLPEPAWSRPLPLLIRKIDRGRYMRTQKKIESLLTRPMDWNCERFSYSLYRLEGIFCILHKR
jgi:SAM-dependent methyltransferase